MAVLKSRCCRDDCSIKVSSAWNRLRCDWLSHFLAVYSQILRSPTCFPQISPFFSFKNLHPPRTPCNLSKVTTSEYLLAM